MRVTMLADKRLKLNKLSSKLFPKGSTLELDVDLAETFIAEGVAEAVGPAPGEFTAEQTKILADAADQIAAARKAAEDAETEAAKKAAEMAEVAEVAEVAASDALEDEEVDLTTKTDAELREIAAKLGIIHTKKTTRDALIAKIVAAVG